MRKATFLFFILICSGITAVSLYAQNTPGQDSTGLPGDNFSLQGALEMFQKVNSPEEFEKLLNAEDNHVNNLDLNGDGDIDYIRVIDNADKEAHAFILQAVVSETESQDIAVIELEKTGDTTAVLQIVGDEDIYGEEVIVEPGEGGDDDNAFINTNNHHIYYGPYPDYYLNSPRVIINVWLWPSVQFVYAPSYAIWRSPWQWHHYPGWWHPWRPFAWHVWHPFHRPYYAHYAVVHTHRVLHAQRIYAPVRTTSVIVRTRHQAAVNHYRVTRTTIRKTNRGPVRVTRTVRRGRH